MQGGAVGIGRAGHGRRECRHRRKGERCKVLLLLLLFLYTSHATFAARRHAPARRTGTCTAIMPVLCSYGDRRPFNETLARLRVSGTRAGFDQTLLWTRQELVRDPLFMRHASAFEKLEHAMIGRPWCQYFKPLMLLRAMELAPEGDYVAWVDASRYVKDPLANSDVAAAIRGLKAAASTSSRAPIDENSTWARMCPSASAALRPSSSRTASAIGILHCADDCSFNSGSLCTENDSQGKMTAQTLEGFAAASGPAPLDSALLRQPHLLATNMLLENSAANRDLMAAWLQMAVDSPFGTCGSHVPEQMTLTLLVAKRSLPVVNLCPYMSHRYRPPYDTCYRQTKSASMLLRALAGRAFSVLPSLAAMVTCDASAVALAHGCSSAAANGAAATAMGAPAAPAASPASSPLLRAARSRGKRVRAGRRGWCREPATAANCSEYAILVSGELRSFWDVRHNFEAALVLPNGPADVFAHVYLDPASPRDSLARDWLAAAPWLRAHALEVFDGEVVEQLLQAFPNYTTACHDLEARNLSSSGVLRMLSMWRKIHLTNELRRAHERKRGRPYRGVVRTRPDLAYGAAVRLSHLVYTSGVGALREERLFLPLPPLKSGATWRLCIGQDGMRAFSCGNSSSTACVDSPLLHEARTAAFAHCPCCHGAYNAVLGRNTCSCTMYFNTSDAAFGPWRGQHVGDQLVLGSGPAMDVFSSMYTYAAVAFEAERAENGGESRMFAGRFVPERSFARLVREEVPWRFLGLAPGENVMLRAGWARERVPVVVQAVDWIQWGKVPIRKPFNCSSSAAKLNRSLQYWNHVDAGHEEGAAAPSCRPGHLTFNVSLTSLASLNVHAGRNRHFRKWQLLKFHGHGADPLLQAPVSPFRLALEYGRWQLSLCRTNSSTDANQSFCAAREVATNDICVALLPTSCRGRLTNTIRRAYTPDICTVECFVSNDTPTHII